MVLHPGFGSGERLGNHWQVLLSRGFVRRDLCWSLDTSQTANCMHTHVNAGITFHSHTHNISMCVQNIHTHIDIQYRKRMGLRERETHSGIVHESSCSTGRRR